MKTSKETILSGSFTYLVDQFALCFPEYRRSIFKILLTSFLTGTHRRNVWQIYERFKQLLLTSSITRRRLYGFLGSGKLPWQTVKGKVLTTILSLDNQTERVMLALDDTSYGKTGRKISGTQSHFDHAAKINQSKYIFGHCRVVLGVLLKIHGRWACLPVGQKLYAPKSDIGSEGLTKIDMAADLIKTVLQFCTRPVLIVADSWFGNRSLKNHFKSWGRVHLLSRLRSNSALFALPEPSSGKRGRRRKYGERLSSLQYMAKHLPKSVQQVFLYGRQRACSICEMTCMSKAMRCPIKVVIVCRTNSFVALFTTDLTLSAEQMIEFYGARWKIESGFKEIKHEIGALDNQARTHNSVENHFEICCLASSLAWIYAASKTRAPVKNQAANNTNSYSFADVRRMIEKEIGHGPIFEGICPDALKLAGKYILASVFGVAA